MPTASEDARIHAEAIVKAACIKAATDLVLAGKILLPGPDSKYQIDYAVAITAMHTWNHLEKPATWPS